MSTVILTRNVDDLGRVVLPAMIAQPLGIRAEDEIMMWYKKGSIVVSMQNEPAWFVKAVARIMGKRTFHPKGISRKVDELNRIVLAADLRKLTHIKKGEIVDVKSCGKKIVILKHQIANMEDEVYENR